jgi:hypothetical protein
MATTLKDWTDRYSQIHSTVFAAVYERMGHYVRLSMADLAHLAELTEQNLCLELLVGEDGYESKALSISREWHRILMPGQAYRPSIDPTSERDCYEEAEDMLTREGLYGDCLEFLASWYRSPR